MKRTAAEVSVRQIEIADDRARCFAHVENICWSACIDGLTSIPLKLLKEEQSLIFSQTANYSTIEPVVRVMHFQVLFILNAAELLDSCLLTKNVVRSST